MRILITGANGFIGSFLVEKGVAAGHEVWAAIRKGSDRTYLSRKVAGCIELDYSDYGLLCRQLSSFCIEWGRWHVVVHAAGVTKCSEKEMFYSGNTKVTENLVNALTELDIVPDQFIFISSLGVFGPVRDTPPYKPILDSDVPCPDTCYGKSKLLAEEYIKALPGFPYVIFRPTGVYGPREKDFLTLIRSVRNHLIVSSGTGSQKLTFVYVKDVVKAVFLAIDKQVVRRAYFVTDGSVYNNSDFSLAVNCVLRNRWAINIRCPLLVVRLLSWFLGGIAALMGRSLILNSDKYRILRQRNWQCDIIPLIKELDYIPDYPLERGVAETVEWYRENRWL